MYRDVLSHITAPEFVKQQLASPSRAAYFGSEFVVHEYKNFLFLRNFEDSTSTQLAFGLQKDSEFRKLFDYHIVKLQQSGMLKLLTHKWFSEEKPEDLSGRIFQDAPMPLGYENLFFPIIIILIGTIGGIITLGIEALVSRARKG